MAEYQCRTNRKQLGKSWRRFIVDQNPQYFVTVTYEFAFTDRTSEEAIKFFVKALVKALPRRVQQTFSAVIASERTVHNIEFDGKYHFHLVICDFNEGLTDPLEWLKENVAYAAKRLRTASGVPMCTMYTTDVQPLEPGDEEMICAYSTKDIYRLERPAGAQILLVKGSKVIGTLLTEGDHHHET